MSLPGGEPELPPVAAAGSARAVALYGGRWRALQGVGLQVLSAAATMVLARLLTPDQFGIVAVVTMVVTLFSLLTEVGFNASIIRRREIGSAEVSSLFWAGSAVGVLAAAVVAALSPVFAALAGNPEAAPYLAVGSLGLAIGLVGSVPRALLLRDFRFKATALTTVGGFLVYMAVAIPLAALTPAGAWAIVVGRVAMAGARVAADGVLSGFRPRLVFRWAAVRADWRFNLGYLGMRVSGYLGKNVDYWFVGSALGAAALGSYYIAYVLPNILRKRMTTAVNGTLFVTLADFHEDRRRVARAYRESIRFVTLAAFPLLVGLALVAPEVVAVFFGSRWLAAVRPMAILSVAAAADSLTPVGSAVFTAIGHPGRNALVSLLRAGVIAAGLFVVVARGDLGLVAVVVLGATLAAVVVQVAFLRPLVRLTVRDVPEAILPAAVSTGVMVVAVEAVTSVLPGDLTAGLVLLVSVGVGAAAYLGSGFLLFSRAFRAAGTDLLAVLVGSGRVGGPRRRASSP